MAAGGGDDGRPGCGIGIGSEEMRSSRPRKRKEDEKLVGNRGKIAH